MKKFELLQELLPLLNPKFYCQADKFGNELVLLDLGHTPIETPISVVDKTQFEAVENHFHLFGKVSKESRETVLAIGTALAENLLRALHQSFPDKRFMVYLSVNYNDSTIIRFHQLWEGEAPYLDTTPNTYKNTTVILFQ